MHLRFSFVLGLLLLSASTASAQFNVSGPSRASSAIGGAVPSGSSGSPVSSPNANLFAFRSSAGNLVSGDTNGASDIFLYVPETGAITRFSLSNTGGELDGSSTGPALSAFQPDGFFGFSFLSTATNVGTYSNPSGTNHVVLKMPPIGFTGLASRRLDGTPGDANSFAPSIVSLAAPNRMFVAFASDATNLVDGDTNGVRDIFLSKFTTDITQVTFSEILKVTKGGDAGTQSNGNSEAPQISGDGRFIVFTSLASNLIAGQTITGGQQIYLFDSQTNTTSLISKAANGVAGIGLSESPKISFQGDFVVYLTAANNVIPGASSSNQAVAMYNVKTGTTVRVNTSSTGEAGNGDASDVSISANGRYVTFSDNSDNLVPSDTNGVADVFTKDLSTGAIVRVSVTSSGSATDGASDSSAIGLFGFNSSSGRIGFRSFADNLVSDGSGNVGNVFASLLTLPLPPVSKDTDIEAPADISLNKRKATVSVQKFGEVVETAGAMVRTSVAPALAAATKPRVVKYDYRFNQVGGKRERFQRLTKRNTETFKRLPAGTYNVKYRVVVQTKKEKTVFKTQFSPTRMIEVRK